MASLLIVLLTISIALLGHYTVSYIRSPLFQIPALHWSSRFSPLYILYTRFQSRENSTLLRAHRLNGPIILLSPTELSVNSTSGIRTIYTAGLPKHPWYLVFRNYNETPNMFTMLDGGEHSRRKRVVSSVYAKSNILRSKGVERIEKEVVKEGLLNHLAEASLKPGDQGVQVGQLLNRVAMDAMSAFIFGRDVGTRFLEDEEGWNVFLKSYNDRGKKAFWTQEMPVLERWLGGSDGQSEKARAWVDKWCMALCENTNSLTSRGEMAEGEAEVWRGLNKVVDGKDLASEVLDHLLAGHETTAIALTYCLYHLSLKPDIQNALREELLTLDPPFYAHQSSPMPSAKSMDCLPLLSAIITETLRLNAPIPGPQPRFTTEGSFLEGYGPFPAGLRVSSNAWSLHRNAEVFPDPETWNPNRWLEKDDDSSGSAHIKDMQRWFWAFGSGGRMCVGSNFALLEMKAVLAAVYTNFRTEIIDSSGIEQKDGYTVGPKKELVLKFVKLKG